MPKPQPYRPPVDKLLTLGEPAKWGAFSQEDWPDYPATLGLTTADIPELIRMATDKSLYHSPSGNPQVWAGLHASRALAQLRSPEAVKPLLEMLDYFLAKISNDTGCEEIPLVLGVIGSPALEPTGLFLANATYSDSARVASTEAIGAIAARHPHLRDACIEQLCRSLEKASWNDESLNGFIISNLINLRASEAANLIRQAFFDGHVDEIIAGNWDHVAPQLGVDP